MGIIVLAIHPDLANPKILGLMKTFGMIALLCVIALSYAKFVMPAVLQSASKSVELMLIISLAWCFFMCSFAVVTKKGARGKKHSVFGDFRAKDNEGDLSHIQM